jgi:hypothetical protein
MYAFLIECVQITPQGIYLVDAINQRLVDKWTPSPPSLPQQNNALINIASCNMRQILVTIGGKKLHLLEINGSKLQHVRSLLLLLLPFCLIIR